MVAIYCKRCGHNVDCHKYERDVAPVGKGPCQGITKKKGQCKCPGFVHLVYLPAAAKHA